MLKGDCEMLLKEYKFGYADATKELIIEPEIFEKAFYDSHNILDKLMNSWKYMLVGRKVRNFLPVIIKFNDLFKFYSGLVCEFLEKSRSS